MYITRVLKISKINNSTCKNKCTLGVLWDSSLTHLSPNLNIKFNVRTGVGDSRKTDFF